LTIKKIRKVPANWIQSLYGNSKTLTQLIAAVYHR
jgi:hypothetical protein